MADHEQGIEQIAKYTGQLCAVLDIMNAKFPEFRSIMAFQIEVNEIDIISGANVGNDVCGSDLTNLLCSIQDAYAGKNLEGANFDLELNVILQRLRNDLEEE